MLKPGCRRFRVEFTPGTNHPHRATCAACAAYATALERAAKRMPMPAGLRSKLRAIPVAVDDAPRFPMPQAPMPAQLRERLRRMSRPTPAIPPPLPAWVRSSRYAVAASYLLAVLTGFVMGNPVEAAGALARSVDSAVRPRVEQTIEGVEDRGLRRLDHWKSAVRERYGSTRNSLEQTLEQSIEHSLGSLEHRAAELDEMRKSLFSLDFLNPRNEGE